MTEGNSSDGFYVNVTRIKKDAIPPDDVDKFAYSDDDYESVKEWHGFTDEERAGMEAMQAKENEKIDLMEAIADLYEAMQKGEAT